MRIIFKIAKAELRSLFYSPIAWFLLLVFLVQCGISYLNLLGSNARTQEIGGFGLEYMRDLTQRIFLSQGGLFSNVMQKLYLYIPLLTMGLMSREMGSGTIKLLYSSPISVVEIVLGKYLAMMIYSLLMIVIVGIFMISGMFNIQFPDGGMLLSGTLGFYLLLCAYSAIGLFMSCLSTYQVVAAVSTFVMIGILSYIGSLWQGIDFVRDLTYFLSISGRTEHMLTGLITSKDVLYFILIILIFVSFTILKMRSGIESINGMTKAVRYTGVLVIALLIGYVGSRPGLIGYYDATVNQSRTLTPNAQKIIRDLGEEPLEVTAYNNLLGRYYRLGLPEQRNQDLVRWEPYMRFKSNIRLNYVSYYDSTYENSYMSRQYPGKSLKQIAEQIAKSSDIDLSKFLTPEQIHQQIDLKPELNRYVMQLTWKGHSTFLRIFNDMQVWPGETEVAAAFKRLQQVRLPKIGFVNSELERDIDKLGDRDYKALTNLPTFRYSLINQGFDVDTVSLEESAIPSDIAALVIADPKIPFSAEAMEKLKHYIDQGGNLLIAGEPGKQEVLNELLQPLGVAMMGGTLIQESKEFAPNLITPELTKAVAAFYKPLVQSIEDSVNVSMPGAAGLQYTPGGPFQVQPLLLTDAKHSWNRVKPLDLNEVTSASSGQLPDGGGPGSQRALALATGTVSFSVADGDTKGPIPAMLGLSRSVNGKEQHIVVAGDADFMSNAELQRNNIRTANFVLSTGIFSWLTGGQFPIDTSRPESKDKRVKVSTDGVDQLKIAYLWVLPGLLLAGGAVLLIRRRRK